MSYFFECGGCGTQEGVDIHELRHQPESLPRFCDGCGTEGCVNCQPRGLCEDCDLSGDGNDEGDECLCPDCRYAD